MADQNKREVIKFMYLLQNLSVIILLYKDTDNLSQLAAEKIQAKIMMKKQLNNYDGVLSQLEFGDKGYGTKKDKKYDLNKYDGVFSQFELKHKENTSKEDKNDDLNKYNGAFPQLEFEDKKCTTNKEKKYNLGFLQSKIIKNIIYCLTERQQIGKN